MNLLEAAWIPVRRASGVHARIAPFQLTEGADEDPIVALDAPRADFNGALVQFLIGLVQTAWALGNDDWDPDGMLDHPPAPSVLQAKFAPLRSAFELDGDGPRYMQDRTLSDADKPTTNAIAALLIDAPGEQTLKRNIDHFIKRDGVRALCKDCAATALTTLMTNAPAGGAGQRTSLRGGGPLTTLVVYQPETANHPPRTLWRDIACNVLTRAEAQAPASGQPTGLEAVFPWFAPQNITQKPGPKAETQPLDVHPLHVYWAMPRRIRLDFEHATQGTCDLCGRSNRPLVSRYATRNYGLNYKGPWQHPLSPYYTGKPGQPPLPVHAGPDGLGYRHWLGWVLGSTDGSRNVLPARVISAALSRDAEAPLRLWTFGYDMDKMKARGWCEGTFPLFHLPQSLPDAHKHLGDIVAQLLAASSLASFALRIHLRDVWFGAGEASGNLGFIDASFWSATERTFFQYLHEAAALVRAHDGWPSPEQTLPLRETWTGELRRVALNLFDRYAASGNIEACHPERLAAAFHGLERQLAAPLQKAAGIPVHETQTGRRQRAALTQAQPNQEAP
ncbi:MAG TPA: type I-E CRISPR-associated protein Cse1/CasA [Rhodanobacteraceae bacterium]